MLRTLNDIEKISLGEVPEQTIVSYHVWLVG